MTKPKKGTIKAVSLSLLIITLIAIIFIPTYIDSKDTDIDVEKAIETVYIDAGDINIKAKDTEVIEKDEAQDIGINIETEPNVDTKIETKSIDKLDADIKEDASDGVKYEITNISESVMANTSLNVRKEPGIEFEKIGIINAYTNTNVIGKTIFKSEEWKQVKLADGRIGWASSKYLEPYDEQKVNKIKEDIKKEKEEASKQSTNKKYNANTIYFSRKSVLYKNSNGSVENAQSIIDGNKYAATFGTGNIFSGTNGGSTTFVGHNPGKFAGIQNAKRFIVTDKNGTPFTYNRTALYLVDEKGNRINSGEALYGRIAGQVNEEMIILQTCKPGTDHNYIVEAKIAK